MANLRIVRPGDDPRRPQFPAAPDFLDEEARAKWQELCRAVQFEVFELDNLAAYCAAWSRFQAAERWFTEDPDRGHVMTITDDKGQVKSHGVVPQVGLSERAAKEMARLGKVLRLERKFKQAEMLARKAAMSRKTSPVVAKIGR